VRPLYHFPLIRDLVVDMAPIKEKMVAAGGAFVPGDDPPAFAPVGGESRERQRIDAAIECIGCGMCVSACTMVAHDPRFPGPAALNRLFTLQTDSRDAGHSARAAVMLSEDSLIRCHSQANCTAVCPMEISPTESILALRRRAVARLFG
jgi:succinate dehydrogenase/fumarate reductase iron-sulfur protein